MKIIHELYKEKDRSERTETARRAFHTSFEAATSLAKGSFESVQTSGTDLKAMLNKAQDDLSPLRVRAPLCVDELTWKPPVTDFNP